MRSVTSGSSYLAMEAKIPSAAVVHLKARGFSFQVFAHVSMERVRSATERCALRRRRLLVSSQNHRSINRPSTFMSIESSLQGEFSGRLRWPSMLSMTHRDGRLRIAILGRRRCLGGR